jgi:hypothetical protein
MVLIDTFVSLGPAGDAELDRQADDMAWHTSATYCCRHSTDTFVQLFSLAASGLMNLCGRNREQLQIHQ